MARPMATPKISWVLVGCVFLTGAATLTAAKARAEVPAARRSPPGLFRGAAGRRPRGQGHAKPDDHPHAARARGKSKRARKKDRPSRTELAKLAPSPGPAQTPEAQRELDRTRLLLLERTESAARRPDATDRWETVLFLASGIDERRYPEAAFWRALAHYRHGDLAEGDAVRGACALPAPDRVALDGERAAAAMLQSMTPHSSGGMEAAAYVDPSSGAPGAAAPSRARNNAAYFGPGPTRSR
jgi:hypothetical protein